MAAAAVPGNAGKDGAVVRRRASRAELVKRWEDLFDNVGDEKATELFMTLLLRDARAEYAQQARTEEEEELRARGFEPWQPTPPGSALPPPPPQPRVERTVVLGLRAPPHLLPRNVKRKPPPPPPPSAPAADLGRRSVKPAQNTRGGV